MLFDHKMVIILVSLGCHEDSSKLQFTKCFDKVPMSQVCLFVFFIFHLSESILYTRILVTK